MKTKKTEGFRGFRWPSKGQIKMFETIAVLVVFFILLMFGLTFYSKIQKITLNRELEEIAVLKAIDTSEQISFLPELQCVGVQDIDCIDILKIDAAEFIIDENRLDYFDTFGFSNVFIIEVYPDTGEEWEIYNLPKKEDKGKLATQFPVSLHDPIEDTYSFGVLTIEIYR